MRTNIRYGLLTALGLIIYFLIMKLIGQESNIYLRFFNFVILIAGTYLLLRNKFKKPGESMTYFNGLSSGMLMNVIAITSFLVFMAIYTLVLDPEFMQVLEKSKLWGSHLSLAEASFAIFIEGMSSGLVISFTWMQYFKKNLPVNSAPSDSAR